MRISRRARAALRARAIPTPEELRLPPALLVPTPRSAARLARALLVLLIIALLGAALAPWRQTVKGEGRVIAFSPDHREQTIDATISGRVRRWHVREGSRVRAGDPLVDLVDNDPARIERLAAERAALALQEEAQIARRAALEQRMQSLRQVQEAQLAMAEADVEVAREGMRSAQQELEAAAAEVETNAVNLARTRELADQGLAAERDRELAKLAARQATTKRAAAAADRRAAQQRLGAAEEAVERIRASTEAELASAAASLREVDTDLADTRASLTRLGGEIARQEAQSIAAPQDGIVQQVRVQSGAEQVSPGDVLAVLVPDTDDRAVELEVDGNDAALLTRGTPVRLQFEGWPAVQFAGWPSVAVGSFGGRVAFVDPSSGGAGRFRAVVVPDEDDRPWPSPRYLRQGVRAKGFFLLREVPLGYEIWRRLNGFPPTVPPPPEEAS